jgi:hypothetical protein
MPGIDADRKGARRQPAHVEQHSGSCLENYSLLESNVLFWNIAGIESLHIAYARDSKDSQVISYVTWMFPTFLLLWSLCRSIGSSRPPSWARDWAGHLAGQGTGQAG